MSEPITVYICRECHKQDLTDTPACFTTLTGKMGQYLMERHFKNDHGRECEGVEDVYLIKFHNPPDAVDFELLMMTGGIVRYRVSEGKFPG